MQGIFSLIRYGSSVFLYIISSFVVLGLSTKLCSNTASFISFIIFSLIVIPLVIKKNNQNNNIFYKSLTIVALFLSTSFEMAYVLTVFRASSDNATTVPGAFVFATIIFTIALICARLGSYTEIKLSNIIFIIPTIALLLSLLAYFTSGATLDVFQTNENKNILFSIIKGISASTLTVSDVYIISYMQEKESCYNEIRLKQSYIISIITIISFTLVYKSMFGNSVSSSLLVPMMSSFGIILDSGLKEVFLFIYSICVLYRLICKLCYSCDILEIVKGKKLNNKILCTVFFFISVNIGALASVYNDILLFIAIMSLLLSFISFIIAPLIISISHKTKKI